MKNKIINKIPIGNRNVLSLKKSKLRI